MTVVGRKEQQEEEEGVAAAQKDLVVTELRA
jgi:hypothetical protein